MATFLVVIQNSTQTASKARQAAENTGSCCNRGLGLLQGKISMAQEDAAELQKHQECPAELMTAIIANNDYGASKWKDKCQGNRTI